MYKTLASTLFVLVFCSSHAFALVNLQYLENEGGGQTSGGGGGVLCKKGRKKTLVTLDYYEAGLSQRDPSKPKEAPSFQIDRFDNPNYDDGSGSAYKLENVTLDALADFSNTLSGTPQLREILNLYLGKIGEIDDWVPASLEEYNDHNKAYKIADKGCKYVQIAVRQGDVIYKDPAMAKLLTASQRALMMVHEAFYYAAKDKVALADSTKIRQLITAILNKMGRFYYNDNNADFKNTALCMLAEPLGLCRVLFPENASPLDRAKYDLIFHPYYNDVMGSLSTDLENLNDQVSKDVYEVYPDQTSALAAKALMSNLILNVDRKYYTVPAMFYKIDEIYKSYFGFGCSPEVDNDQKIIAPNLTLDQIGYCKATAKILRNAILKVDEGYTKHFCVQTRDNCPLSLDVIPLEGWMRPTHTQTERSDWYGDIIGNGFGLYLDLENYKKLESENR